MLELAPEAGVKVLYDTQCSRYMQIWTVHKWVDGKKLEKTKEIEKPHSQ